MELKPLLREGRSDDEIRDCIVEAVKQKPRAHAFSENQIAEKEDQRKMVQIGG